MGTYTDYEWRVMEQQAFEQDDRDMERARRKRQRELDPDRLRDDREEQQRLDRECPPLADD
jgi:hypothetical protein